MILENGLAVSNLHLHMITLYMGDYPLFLIYK